MKLISLFYSILIYFFFLSYFLIECVSFFYIFADYSYSIHITEIRVPKHVITGADAQLECRYDLAGDALYSVKWYKDGNEFYRYVPRDMPPAQVFKLPGVHVVVSFFHSYFLVC